MGWTREGAAIVIRRRSPALPFAVTFALGFLFGSEALVGLIRLLAHAPGPRPSLAALGVLGIGGLALLTGGLAGLTGRSEVVVDPAQRRVRVRLRVLAMTRERVHGFQLFDRIELLSGRSRTSRFWFPALRGKVEVALGRWSLEEARALALALGETTCLPVREPPERALRTKA